MEVDVFGQPRPLENREWGTNRRIDVSIDQNTQGDTPIFWAAPELIDAGYKVFPVDRKAPTVEGGFYGATVDKSQVAAWIEDGRGHHDIAIPTGVFGGLVAIDADTPEAFEEMKAKYGPPTYTTKRGGHWLFRHPRNGKVISSKFAPGLDRKGDGGYVIFPPSKGRQWTNSIPRPEDLPELPREFWSKSKGPTPGERKVPQDRKDAAAALIAEHVRGITPETPGAGRHDHLRHVCGVLLGREVSLVDSEDILKAAWGKVGGDLSERLDSEVPNTLATTQAAMTTGNATGIPSMEGITPGLYAALEAAMKWPVLHATRNGSTPTNPADPLPDDPSIDSDHIHGGFDRNKSTLPLKTVEEIIEEAGDGPSWVVENILARGALTDFSGLAKKGGKTTFWLHGIAAGARGEDHGGFATESAKYLYLTEQGNNFAEALQDAGLSDHPDHVRIVQFKDVSAVEWDRLIREAGAETKRLGFDVLVVDTFAVFARLKGSEENDSGAVGDRMRVLRLVAQRYGIAVVLVRHAGKDGTPRGSSAFEAEADICVTISRPEGRHDPSVRKLSGVGRYGEFERNVQLHEGRYISLGTDDRIEFNKAIRFVKAMLPDSPEAGMKKQDLLDRRGEADNISSATLARALQWLVKQGDVGEKQVMDQRGKPKVYWLAYKPPGGDGGIYFNQTPTHNNDNDRNKPEGVETPDPTPRELGVEDAAEGRVGEAF